MNTKEAYKEKIEAQLKEWDSKVQGLKAKVSETAADARIKAEEEIREVEKQRNIMMEKLEALKGIGENKWESLKAGIDEAWHGMESSLKKISDKFK